MTLGVFLPDVCFKSNNFAVLAEVCPLLRAILVGNVFYILIARWFGTLFFVTLVRSVGALSVVSIVSVTMVSPAG